MIQHRNTKVLSIIFCNKTIMLKKSLKLSIKFFSEFPIALCSIMMIIVLKSNNQYSEILCVTAETSMRKFMELK